MSRLGKPLADMADLSDTDLARLAETVFRQGLIDGRTESFPRSRDAVMYLIPAHPHRIIHKRKLRQVYGAGYDISRLMRQAKAKAETPG